MILEYIVTGNEMKLLDDTTSQVFLVPSVVLMEQAAAGVVRELVACFDKSKEFAVICGRGNNAGDGIAIARLLNQPDTDAWCTMLLAQMRQEASSLSYRKIYTQGMALMWSLILSVCVKVT